MSLRTSTTWEEHENVLVLPERYDSCLIGWVDDDQFGPQRSCYSLDKVLQVLQDLDGMSYEEAYEFFEFNIGGAYVTPAPPVFVTEVHHGEA